MVLIMCTNGGHLEDYNGQINICNIKVLLKRYLINSFDSDDFGYWQFMITYSSKMLVQLMLLGIGNT